MPNSFFRKLAAKVVLLIKNPEKGIGTELFEAIAQIVPQSCVEAIILDNIDKPTKLLLTPRNDNRYQNLVHCPGSFIRFGETFEQTLHRLIKNELSVGIRRFRYTNYSYSFLEKHPTDGNRHLIGFVFLVEINNNPKTGNWFDHIPSNLMLHHKDFLKKTLGWTE